MIPKLRTILAAMALSATVAWLVMAGGGVNVHVFRTVTCVLGVIGICFFVTARSTLAPPLNRWMAWGWIALLAYVVLQSVPLPVSLIEVLSPARRELLTMVDTISAQPSRFASLTISPQTTFEHWGRLCAYFLVFLLIRELVWRSGRPWSVAVLPLVSIALLEAAIGISQFFLSGGSNPATGTYVNRNHFAGLLQMAIPLTAAYCCELASKTQRLRNAIALCFCFVAAGILLTAVMCSLSRMAAVSSLLSCGLVVILLVRPRPLYFGAALLFIPFALILLSPTQLVMRFNELLAEDVPATRILIWAKTLKIIADYWLIGCGLGTFSEVLVPYDNVIPGKTVDFSHNDYLQVLAELGILGVIPLAILAALVCREAAVALRRTGAVRALGAGCSGALFSIGLSSFVDFNLYIPANAVVLAWIAALAVMLRHVNDNSEIQREAGGEVRKRLRRPVEVVGERRSPLTSKPEVFQS